MINCSLAFALLASAVAVVQASVLQRRAVKLPTGNGKFDYQLGGAYTPPSGTVMVVRDREEAPFNPGTIYNVCYINGFQTQPDPEDVQWWKGVFVNQKENSSVTDIEDRR